MMSHAFGMMDKAESLNDFYFTSAQRNKDQKYVEK